MEINVNRVHSMSVGDNRSTLRLDVTMDQGQIFDAMATMYEHVDYDAFVHTALRLLDLSPEVEKLIEENQRLKDEITGLTAAAESLQQDVHSLLNGK